MTENRKQIAELKERIDAMQRETAYLIASNDQTQAALRDALAEMTDGLNETQATYVREQVDRMCEALAASAIHPAHYGEAAEHLWEQFGPAIARGVAAREGATDGA